MTHTRGIDDIKSVPISTAIVGSCYKDDTFHMHGIYLSYITRNLGFGKFLKTRNTPPSFRLKPHWPTSVLGPPIAKVGSRSRTSFKLAKLAVEASSGELRWCYARKN